MNSPVRFKLASALKIRRLVANTLLLFLLPVPVWAGLPSVWVEHRSGILGIIGLIIIETALIFGLVTNLRSRRKAEQALSEREKDLRFLTRRLLSAQEEERSLVARELHDDVTQQLAVLAIDMGRLELQFAAGPPQVLERLGFIKQSLIKLSEDIHALSRQLHPSILDDLGLVKAVQSECARLARKEGLEVLFSHEGVPETIPRDISLTLYRILQSACRNIVKHSRANRARILLKGVDSAIQLIIEDTGIGFSPLQVREKPGLGLASMKERVSIVHGEISIRSAPGEGTVIDVKVPLEEREP